MTHKTDTEWASNITARNIREGFQAPQPACCRCGGPDKAFKSLDPNLELTCCRCLMASTQTTKTEKGE